MLLPTSWIGVVAMCVSERPHDHTCASWRRACRRLNAPPTPDGGTASFVERAGKNTALIQQTGNIPVFLAGTEHDGIMPGDANRPRALRLAGELPV